MNAVYRKELKGYFTDGIGLILIAVELAVACGFMWMFNLGVYKVSAFEYALSPVSFVYTVAVPLLTMRLFAEEKKQGTDRLLYSLPLKMSGVALGKYFAVLTVLAVPAVVMCAYPLVLSLFGAVNFKSAYACVLAFFLLGAALAAVGMFISSVCAGPGSAVVVSIAFFLANYLLMSFEDNITGSRLASYFALIGVIALFGWLLYLMTKNSLLACGAVCVLAAALIALNFVKPELLTGLIPGVLSAVSLFRPISVMATETTFDVKAAVVYISVAVFFIYLTVAALERRRWA